MKLLQKRPAAAVIMVLAILAGIAMGRAKAPAAAGVSGEFLYLIHNEGGVITKDTAEYIEAMNESLFAQTGAQIAVDVVETTGSMDIADYGEELFTELGVGSRERNNGILLILALKNMYNGAPDGDYYITWGSGFTSSQQDRLADIPYDYLEDDFSAKKYDRGVRLTFDALVEYLEGVYHVNVSTAPVSPEAMGSYQSLSGGYSSEGTAMAVGSVISGVIILLIVLFILWIVLDGLRYRSYRRRYFGPTVIGIPRPVYYPVFWGRPRPPRRPPPPPPRPPRPPGGPGAGPGSFTGGGTFGGGARRPPTGGGTKRPPSGGFGGGSFGGFGGGSFGGGAGRGGRPGGFGGGSFGGGAGRGGGGRSFGGGSFGGGAGRSGGGGGRRR